MEISKLFFFSSSLLFLSIFDKYFSKKYLYDLPNDRKKHLIPISQVGGIAFALISLVVIYFLGLPNWFLFGSIFSLFIGIIDDCYNIRWPIKLFLQLLLLLFIFYIFWGRFNHFSFYIYHFSFSQPILFVIFSIWFIGIFNAVNLIDGADGLAAGYIFIISIFLSSITQGLFSEINILYSLLMLVYLIYNQRPAKMFMGDAGSLFLGFYVATLPLLYMDLVEINSFIIITTPFIILASFLIADTSRVFFARIIDGKNPMTADTIHFHHLIFQSSGSYIATLFIIYFIVFVSGFFGIVNQFYPFGQNGMLIHITMLFIFILTPPIPTYVNIISNFINPVYLWQKSMPTKRKNNIVSKFVTIIFSCLIISISFSIIYKDIFLLPNLAAFTLFLIFLIINKKKKIILSSIQIFICLFIYQFVDFNSINIFSKLFIIFSIVSLFIFTIQRRFGTAINQYSAIDVLVLLLVMFGSILSLFSFINTNIWIFLIVFVFWFKISFLVRRTKYLV